MGQVANQHGHMVDGCWIVLRRGYEYCAVPSPMTGLPAYLITYRTATTHVRLQTRAKSTASRPRRRPICDTNVQYQRPSARGASCRGGGVQLPHRARLQKSRGERASGLSQCSYTSSVKRETLCCLRHSEVWQSAPVWLQRAGQTNGWSDGLGEANCNGDGAPEIVAGSQVAPTTGMGEPSDHLPAKHSHRQRR